MQNSSIAWLAHFIFLYSTAIFHDYKTILEQQPKQSGLNMLSGSEYGGGGLLGTVKGTACFNLWSLCNLYLKTHVQGYFVIFRNVLGQLCVNLLIKKDCKLLQFFSQLLRDCKWDLSCSNPLSFLVFSVWVINSQTLHSIYCGMVDFFPNQHMGFKCQCPSFYFILLIHMKKMVEVKKEKMMVVLNSTDFMDKGKWELSNSGAVGNSLSLIL